MPTDAKSSHAALRALARGIALFFGVFSLADTTAILRIGHTDDLGWVDSDGLLGTLIVPAG